MAPLMVALVIFTIALPASSNGAAPNTQSVNQLAADTPPREDVALKIDQLRERDARIQDLEREGAVLRAKSDLDQSAYSRLENYLGAFGILITLVALAFGLSTREAAVAAARRGIEDEINAIKTLLITARTLLSEIQKHAEDAEAIKNKMSNQVQSSDSAVQESQPHAYPAKPEPPLPLSEASPSEEPKKDEPVPEPAEAESTSPAEPAPATASYADFSKSYYAALGREDFREAIKIARESRRLYKKGIQIAESFSREGYALDKIGQTTQAVKSYERCIARLKKDYSSWGRHVLGQVLFNLALIYGDKLGDRIKEIELYDQAIDASNTSEESRARVIVSKALVNKAVELARLGRTQEALATDERVITMFSASEDDDLQKQVKMAQRHKAKLTKV